MKKFLLIFVSAFILLSWYTQAQSLIPEWWGRAAEYVSQVAVPWQVIQEQKNLIKNWISMSDQFASWIFGWDTILDYCVYLIQFLWEVALLVWAVAIIYLWYKRITKNLFWEAPKGLTMVVIWLLVVIFAYVIVKLIWAAFIS